MIDIYFYFKIFKKLSHITWDQKNKIPDLVQFKNTITPTKV